MIQLRLFCLAAFGSLPLLASQCSPAASEPGPQCSASIQAKIAELEALPKSNPAYEVWQYTFRGQPVYLVTAPCCDQYETLYDACLNVLCAPGGGLSGQGDGRCPEFYRLAADRQLVWRDPR
ncbi:DUF6970 domain-containing protein [Hymenobacter nivis]|uniref:DUF6970 domain-containing protein n=1 Tax=Hymenobacter nivis TaxID=1850093 RepID=A0A2Z3GQR2_9BACT|nr:hypothetical protein [Hymenobacter nivis]AWM33636.1 hypothetical protein DDQ68_13090 [Hymenobacter nivis]